MLLHRLRLDFFRNYINQDITFDSQINLIYGENAQGKSNLLEAVSYLSAASSFRGAKDWELINFSKDYFYIEGEMTSKEEGRFTLSAAANTEGRHRWLLNREPKTLLSDVVGLLHTVVFAPEDIYLIKSGPASRRRWLNRQMSQNSSEYFRLLMVYNQILKQRNACLKALQKGGDEEELSAWDQQFLKCAINIMALRFFNVRELDHWMQTIHARLSGGEEARLVYESDLAGVMETNIQPPVTDNTADENLRLEEILLSRGQQLLRKNRYREILAGHSLVGPHLDELRVVVDNKPARGFASQGQQRTLALSLKLAELELAQQKRGEYPLLLLDDVLSELDDKRRQHILAYVGDKTQTFITAVSDANPLGGKKIFISNGQAKPGDDARES